MSTEHKTYPRPAWVKSTVMAEEELCPDCFKVVGVKSRYQLVCFLGKQRNAVSVTKITNALGLTQPTVTHHLNILKSVDAVVAEKKGREHLYSLNRSAHCFEDCMIPYS